MKRRSLTPEEKEKIKIQIKNQAKYAIQKLDSYNIKVTYDTDDIGEWSLPNLVTLWLIRWQLKTLEVTETSYSKSFARCCKRIYKSIGF